MKSKLLKIYLFISVIFVSFACGVAYGQSYERNKVKDEKIAKAEDDELPITTDDYYSNLREKYHKNRGKDINMEANDYVGLEGYAAVSKYEMFDSEKKFFNDWSIPVYKRDRNALIEIGNIPHKTQIKITGLDKDLEYSSRTGFCGMVEILDLDTQEKYLMDIENFVLDQWWKLPIKEAAYISPFKGEYHQKSNEYPIKPNTGEPVTNIPDGANVIITEYNRDGYLEGYIWMPNDEWFASFYYINPEDITYTY